MSSIKSSTTIPAFVFSSKLDSFSFTTDLDSITVHITCNSEDLLTTTLYAHYGRVTLYELRQIIEEFMIKEEYSFSSFFMYADCYTNEGVRVVSNNVFFGVIYCHHMLLSNVSAETYALQHFLFSGNTMILTPKDELILPYWTEKSEGEVTRQFNIVYSVDGGEKKQCLANLSSTYSDYTEVLTDQFDYEDILVWPATKEGLPVDRDYLTKHIKVHAVTALYNSRILQVYYIHETDTLSLSFHNIFNCLASVSFRCKLTEKNITEKSDAISNSQLVFYDEKSHTEFDVEAHCISQSHYRVLHEALMSQRVWVKVPYIGDLPVLITDITSELSNQQASDSMKFKFRFPADMAVFNNAEPTNTTHVFNEVFNHVFK